MRQKWITFISCKKLLRKRLTAAQESSISLATNCLDGQHSSTKEKTHNLHYLNMEQKFKKGDLVKFKHKNSYMSVGHGYEFKLLPNAPFKVNGVSGGYIRIDCGEYNSGRWWPMSEFEIVNRAFKEEMKTEEFKTGDKVFVIDGKKHYEGKILDTEYMIRDEPNILVKYKGVAGHDQTSTCFKDGRLREWKGWSIVKELPFDWAALWAAVPSWHDEIVCQPSGEWTSRKDVNGIFDFIHIPKELAPPFTKDLVEVYKRPSL